MAISASCVCGKSYRLKDEMAGKRVRCAQCAAVFDVPAADVETGFEVVDSAPAPPARSTASAFRSNSAAPAPAPRLAPPDEFSPPPPKRKKNRRRYRDEGGGFHIAISPGIIAGIAMMVGATVWFVLGLFLGWIFFYPPILFVIGLVRFVMSVMGHEED